jgi:hypothetical protein
MGSLQLFLGKYFPAILPESPNRVQNTIVGVVEVNRGVGVANMFLYPKCKKMVSDGRLWEICNSGVFFLTR